MSTRANILIFEWKKNGKVETTFLYRHSDGYPESTLTNLYEILERLEGFRSVDLETITTEKLLDELAQETFKGFNEEERSIYQTNCNSIHGDIEYLYYIYLNHPNFNNNIYCIQKPDLSTPTQSDCYKLYSTKLEFYEEQARDRKDYLEAKECFLLKNKYLTLSRIYKHKEELEQLKYHYEQIKDREELFYQETKENFQIQIKTCQKYILSEDRLLQQINLQIEKYEVEKLEKEQIVL